MEAIAALGFAANIVQFVDFSTRVISQTVRVYRARSQSSIEQDATDLEEIGLRIERYVAPLEFDAAVKEYLSGKPWISELSRKKANKANSAWKRTKQPILQLHHVTHERPELDDFTAEAHKLLKTTNAITRLSTSDKEIIRICIKCEEVASSLQQALSNLKDTSRLKTSLWNSFTEALKTVWGDEKLQGVKQQLADYRQQMTSLLLVSVRLVGSSPPDI
jgi:predicted phage tail protein